MSEGVAVGPACPTCGKPVTELLTSNPLKTPCCRTPVVTLETWDPDQRAWRHAGLFRSVADALAAMPTGVACAIDGDYQRWQVKTMEGAILGRWFSGATR